MVNITPEEVMEQRKAKPEFSEFDRKLIGGGVRIEVPMDSRGNLKRFAELFEEMAQNFRVLSTTTKMTPRQAMIEASFQAYSVRRRIQEIAGVEPRHGARSLRQKVYRSLEQS